MACVYRVVNRGTGYILAIAALSLLVLSHLIYAYMMAITVILIVIVGARRATIVPRFVRLGHRRRGGRGRDHRLPVAAVHHDARST